MRWQKASHALQATRQRAPGRWPSKTGARPRQTPGRGGRGLAPGSGNWPSEPLERSRRARRAWPTCGAWEWPSVLGPGSCCAAGARRPLGEEGRECCSASLSVCQDPSPQTLPGAEPRPATRLALAKLSLGEDEAPAPRAAQLTPSPGLSRPAPWPARWLPFAHGPLAALPLRGRWAARRSRPQLPDEGCGSATSVAARATTRPDAPSLERGSTGDGVAQARDPALASGLGPGPRYCLPWQAGYDRQQEPSFPYPAHRESARARFLCGEGAAGTLPTLLPRGLARLRCCFQLGQGNAAAQTQRPGPPARALGAGARQRQCPHSRRGCCPKRAWSPALRGE